MMFVFTFLLVASLEMAVANDSQKSEVPVKEKTEKEFDLCVGCESEEELEKPPNQLKVEVRIDPVTGEVLYVIKGLVIE